MGLHRAGFDVVGVDIEPQPNFPFRFVQGDALKPPVALEEFDLIWASPPCQKFTAYRRRPGHVKESPNLIPDIRALLQASGAAYIIENVDGAPLYNAVRLCGSMFGLDVRRHRHFECSPYVLAPPCRHVSNPRFPQATNRENPRSTVEVGAWRIPLETQQRAMGIDWMSLEELSQAIPPAFSEFLGKQILRALAVRA